MVSSGCFRVVSDRFQTLLGALTGLCSFPRKEAELNAPAMKPKQNKMEATNPNVITFLGYECKPLQ